MLVVLVLIEAVAVVLLGAHLAEPPAARQPAVGVSADGVCLARPRVEPRDILAVRSQCRGFTDRFLEERGVGPHVASMLQSYQEHTLLYANVERASSLAGERATRLDPGLIELKREGLRQGAATLLEHQQALQYERGLFEHWERAWQDQEASLVRPGGAPRAGDRAPTRGER